MVSHIECARFVKSLDSLKVQSLVLLDGVIHCKTGASYIVGMRHIAAEWSAGPDRAAKTCDLLLECCRAIPLSGASSSGEY
jgi:hypothetical protein